MPKTIAEKQAYVEVSRTLIRDGKRDYKVRVKKIKIRPFVTDTANVSIKYGLTIPTIEYGSARVDVMLSCPCYVEEIRETYENLRQLADELIDAEADRIEGDEDD